MADDPRLSNDTCNLRQEWISTATMKQLVERCTDAKLTPPDRLEYYQVVHLEMSDRIKESPQACSELGKEIFRVLSVDNSIRI